MANCSACISHCFNMKITQDSNPTTQMCTGKKFKACTLTSREGIFKSPLKTICLTKKTSVLGQPQCAVHIITTVLTW